MNLGWAGCSEKQGHAGASFVLDEEIVFHRCGFEMGQGFLVQVGHEKRERWALQILVVGQQSGGHLQQEWKIVGLVSLELSGSVGQDVEGSLVIVLAQGSAHASFVLLQRGVYIGDQSKLPICPKESHHWYGYQASR